MNMTHFFKDRVQKSESCLLHVLNSHVVDKVDAAHRIVNATSTRWPVCSCPSTCDEAALSRRNSHFSCEQRIRYMIRTHKVSEEEACLHASSQGQDPPCGPECNPNICSVAPLDPITTNNATSEIFTDALYPPLTSIVEDSNVTGDASWLLNFAIIGFPKCGTSTMMSYLAGNETQVPQWEICDLGYNKPGRYIQKLHEEFTSKHQQGGAIVQHGVKCPRGECGILMEIPALTSIPCLTNRFFANVNSSSYYRP